MTTPTRGQDADTHQRTQPDQRMPASTDRAGATDSVGTNDKATRTGIRSLRHRLRAADLRTRLTVAAVLTAALLLLTMTPLSAGLGGGQPWVEFALTTPVVLWAAWPFHRRALDKARQGSAATDALVSVGIMAAYAFSLVATLAGGDWHRSYVTAAVITTLLLAGRVAEARLCRAGRRALQSLLDLRCSEVTVLTRETGGTTREKRISIEQLAVGMRFLVRPGEKLAADGVVLKGSSAIDTARVTGESVAVDVEPGDRVLEGTVSTTGPLLVRAEAVGADTALAGITRLVEAAQTDRAPLQRVVARASSVFVPVVFALAALAFVGWLVTGHALTAALSAAVAVMIVACPSALGLATSTALVTGAGRGAQLGLLLKSARVLESSHRVDTVALDKAGTVTSGQLRLIDIAPAGRLTSTAALQAAAAVESGSAHSIAAAIVEAARKRGLAVPTATDVWPLPSGGVRGRIKDTEVTVGRADLFERIPEQIAAPDPAGTTVYVGWGGIARAALTLADGVRPDSRAGLVALHDLGLTTYLLTSDNATTAARIAQEVGIEAGRVISGVRPEDKAAIVQGLRREGHVVATVGDGNGEVADLRVAVSGDGRDIATQSADIVIMRAHIAAVADAIHLSRRILRVCRENLAWAFAYHVIAIPLAVFGWIDPMVAAAAAAAASGIVVCNSLRLRSVGTAAHEDPWDAEAVAVLQGDRAPRRVERDGQQPSGAVRRDEAEGDDAGGLVGR